MRRRLDGCRRGLALGLALALAMPGAALAGDLASDLGGDLSAAENTTPVETPAPVNMDTAEVVIGYIAGENAQMNPFICTEWNLISVNQLVFESVVDLDENMKPVPMLADSWQHRGDTWRFKLRSGIQFHNGYELTAYDVVQSYETILQAGSRNPYYTRVQAIRAMKADENDDHVVLVQARGNGLAALYGMTFPVVQYNTVTDDLPRGTGPYWYIQKDGDGTVRLEANPLWWKQQPGVHSILLKRYAEAADAVEAIHTNQINMMATISPKAALSRRLSDVTSMDFATLTYEMLVPNLHRGSLMSDVRVRRAVMYAIDRATIAANAYVDMAIQSEVPIVPNSWLYESQSAIFYYSPERALQLMNEVGWRDMTGDGKLNRLDGIMVKEPTVRIVTYNESTNSIRENAANLIAGYLEDIGFNVQVGVGTKDRVREAMRSRNYDLALVGVNLSEVPSLTELLGSGGAINLNGYSNEAMDALLSRAAGTSSETNLQKLYSEIQMTVVDRLPIMGLLFRSGTVLSSRPIGGLYGLRAYDTFNGFEFLAGAPG